MTNIDIPIDTDPQDILNECYTFLQTVVPGWTPNPGSLDVWLLMSMAFVAAESRDVASAVPSSIFRWFGANLLQLPPQDAQPASGTTTWTMLDNAGYTIPDGTQVGVPASGDVSYVFLTSGDVTVPPGSTTATITIIAQDPGADSTNLGAPGSTVDLIDPLTFVSTITLTGPTAGGVDAEADDDYLSRLVAELQLLAPRPILPADFSVFARNIPGVYRATTIDGYNPSGPSTGNPRMVTVISIDQNGNPVSTPVKAAVAADLTARREVNFVVNTADANVVLIDVTYNAKALVGQDPTALATAVNTALSGYLNPATWGTDISGDPQVWNNVTTVRYLEIANVINDVSGVDYIVSLTIGIHGGSMGTSDLTMTGIAPLANDGTITGVIS